MIVMTLRIRVIDGSLRKIEVVVSGVVSRVWTKQGPKLGFGGALVMLPL
jgi:hypothetical protein